MRKILGSVPLLVVFVCLSPACLHAYCGAPNLIRPSGEYYQSDVVFVGTVISAQYNSAAGGYYRLRVARIFKGPIRAEFDVSTYSDDGRYPLERGRSYLLFARIGYRMLEITSCGNSNLLSQSAKTIRVLERLPYAPDYGAIEGWLVSPNSDAEVSGVRVIIDGGSREYSAVTDKNGWFHVRVPIGRYKVDLSSGEYYLDPQENFFQYNAQDFVLHPGETASLQFVSARHAVKQP
jgi:hypothetical protein